MNPPPTGAELLDRARSLLPELRQRAAETEKQRMVSPDVIAMLREVGLTRVGQPERFGGVEVGMDVVSALIAELATACGATGWVYGILLDHNITMGMFPAEAQEDLWGDDPHMLVSSGIAPAGKAVRVDGGFRVTGRWNFSSGCDHCQWVFVHTAAPPEKDGDAPTPTYFLLPRSDYEIIDTWYVMGLSGTGSKDINIDNAFVPTHRTVSIHDININDSPGCAVNPGVIYKLPRVNIVPFALVSTAMGLVTGLYDTFVAQIRERQSRGIKLAELQSMQMRVAEASAEIDSARLLLQRDTAETMEAIRRDGTVSDDLCARNRRDMAYVAVLCSRAAERLFSATGGGGLYTGNEMQRMYRDVRAVAAHHINSWDISGTLYGKYAFGLGLDS